MGLEEKIENVLINWIDNDYDRQNVSCEIVYESDNFAIDFSNWLMIKCTYMSHCVFEYQGEEYTQRELLEIYKKTL